MKKYFLILIVLALLAAGKATAQIEDVVWQVPMQYVLDMKFSPDSKYIVCYQLIGQKHQVAIVKVENGEILKVIEYEKFPEFTPGGQYLATVNDNKLTYWNTDTYELEQELTLEVAPGRLAFSSDMQYLASACDDRGLCIYDTQNWQLIKQITDFPYIDNKTQTAKPRAHYVDFSFDNKYVAFSGDWTFLYNMEKDTIEKMLYGREPQFSPVRNELLIKKIDYNKQYHPVDGFYYFKFDETQEPSHLSIGGYSTFDYKFSADGNYVATCSYLQKTDVWDLISYNSIFQFKFNPLSVFEEIDISSDNKYLVTYNGLMILLNIENVINVEEEYIEKSKIINTYPNPTSKEIRIEYELNEAGNTKLLITDGIAKSYQVILDEYQEPGAYSAQYSLEALPSGIYFIELSQNGFKDSQKIILSK